MISVLDKPEDFPVLLAIWEASVRATHDFLTPEKIEEIKQIIIKEKVFSFVDIYVYNDSNGSKTGFIGIANNKIEMLFILPECRGKGIGRALTEFVISAHQVTKVDVNEQNPQAVGFYEKMGFNVINRCPMDSLGNPFPILEMELVL
ncbi:MAG TPA: GNAT family N-acetyltransferase [Lunatimonas sp.]|nr:GNAT family N-acetyltransferase [Lunatimonas sp.]